MKTHLHHIYRKLGVAGRVEAILEQVERIAAEKVEVRQVGGDRITALPRRFLAEIVADSGFVGRSDRARPVPAAPRRAECSRTPPMIASFACGRNQAGIAPICSGGM